MNPYLSIIIPAYNEEARIGRTLERAIHFLSKKPYTTEILVVDDGSTDRTIEVVTQAQKHIPNGKISLRAIPMKINRGKGYAVRAGMLASRGTRALLMDADASVRIETLDYFMYRMDATKADILIGSLAHPDSTEVERTSFYRRPLRRLSQLVLRILFRLPVVDTQRPFKLFTREAVHGTFYRCTLERWALDIEVLTIATSLHFKILEMPINWDNPPGSKVRLSCYVFTFLEALKIYKRMWSGAYGRSTLHYS